VQGRLGLIPQEAADEIISHCTLSQIDMVKLRQQTERIGYPILGVVSQLNALCRDKLGEYCHWGATTQDITDTATVLQIREALDLVEQELAGIAAAMAKLAKEHRDTPMIGRSNLQQAIPVTFGYKMAGLLSAVQRHQERLAQLRERVLVGEFAGAAGTLASLQTGAMETQAGLCAELGLKQPVIAWHTIRDNIAEVGTVLGLIGGTLGKLSMDVKLMMQTEVGEVYEPYAHGRGSSSTMPQKRNPISSCYIHAAISVVRQHAAALMDAMVADHERSTGPGWGDRVDRAAGGVLPDGRGAAAVALRAGGAGGGRGRDAPQHRHDARAGDERGGDDGPGAVHRPRVRARPGLRHLPRRREAAAPAARPAGRTPADQRPPGPRRAGRTVRPGELSGAVGRDGGPGARPVGLTTM